MGVPISNVCGICRGNLKRFYIPSCNFRAGNIFIARWDNPKENFNTWSIFMFSSKIYNSKRKIQEDIPPLIHGHCLLIIVHYIHALIQYNPLQINFIVKYDIKSAYRIGTVWGCLAKIFITVVQDLALLSCILTFGGLLYPFTSFVIINIFTNLANDLLIRK